MTYQHITCGAIPSFVWFGIDVMVSLQVKVQTVPGFANGLFDGMPKVIAQEGFGGYASGSIACMLHHCAYHFLGRPDSFQDMCMEIS
jgi:hypothetical protein